MAVLMQATVSGMDEAVYRQMTGGDFLARLNAFEGYVGVSTQPDRSMEGFKYSRLGIQRRHIRVGLNPK